MAAATGRKAGKWLHQAAEEWQQVGVQSTMTAEQEHRAHTRASAGGGPGWAMGWYRLYGARLGCARRERGKPAWL